MVAASAASYSSSYRSWRYLNTCSSCDSMDGSRSMQTINNRHHCHRSSHQQYYHTRKPALKRQKRCTFATTATVAESTGLGSSSDITGIQNKQHFDTPNVYYNAYAPPICRAPCMNWYSRNLAADVMPNNVHVPLNVLNFVEILPPSNQIAINFATTL